MKSLIRIKSKSTDCILFHKVIFPIVKIESLVQKRGGILGAILEQKQSASMIFSILADLYKFPESDIWEDFSCHQLLDELRRYASEWYESNSLVEITDLPTGLKQMQQIYAESLGGPALPVESVYKEWTADRTCNLPFARSKGYLLGDSALHIRFILEEFEIEIPENYRNTPDHLAILLELLAFFLLHAKSELIKQFLEDHFDWLDEFALRLEELGGTQFYLQVTRFLQQMLKKLTSIYGIEHNIFTIRNPVKN